jgi:hypothetical protein
VVYHNLGTHYDKSQWFSMGNEPACHKQSDSQKNSNNCKPIFPGPPEGKQEAYAQDDAGNFARNNIEAAKD